MPGLIAQRALGAALGALLTFAALGAGLAALPSVAAAQPERGRRPVPAPTAAAALEAELRLTTERHAEVAALIRRVAARVEGRRSSAALTDSLSALVSQLTALNTRRAVLEARLRAEEAESRLLRTAPVGRQPEGWFGVHVETVSSGEVRPGGATVVRSVEYPKVLSVEPGSPAARAGMAAGDRLLAIAGVDLRRSAFDPRTLRPGQTVPVRISREGRPQELRVAITPRPRTFASGVTVRVASGDEVRELARTNVREGRSFVQTVPGAPPGAIVSVEALPEGVVMVPAGTQMPAPARSPSSATAFFYASPSVAAVAGVEVVRLDSAFRSTLEVRDGVLVVQVARSSPGERAGLRQGDVLVRANGVTLAHPLVFQRVVAEARGAGADGVRLELVRAKKAQTVALRW